MRTSPLPIRQVRCVRHHIRKMLEGQTGPAIDGRGPPEIILLNPPEWRVPACEAALASGLWRRWFARVMLPQPCVMPPLPNFLFWACCVCRPCSMSAQLHYRSRDCFMVARGHVCLAKASTGGSSGRFGGFQPFFEMPPEVPDWGSL